MLDLANHHVFLVVCSAGRQCVLVRADFEDCVEVCEEFGGQG